MAQSKVPTKKMAFASRKIRFLDKSLYGVWSVKKCARAQSKAGRISTNIRNGMKLIGSTAQVKSTYAAPNSSVPVRLGHDIGLPMRS